MGYSCRSAPVLPDPRHGVRPTTKPDPRPRHRDAALTARKDAASHLEPMELARMKHQGRYRMVALELVNPQHDDLVIAPRMDRVDAAAKPGARPIQNYRTVRRRAPAQVGKPVRIARRKLPAGLLLISGQHAHAEGRRIAKYRPCRRCIGRADRDERRIQRHRSERTGRHAHRDAIDERGYHDHPRRERTKYATKFRRTERLGYRCHNPRPII